MLRQCLSGAAVIAGLFSPAAGTVTASELATAIVQSPGAGESASFDGSDSRSGRMAARPRR